MAAEGLDIRPPQPHARAERMRWSRLLLIGKWILAYSGGMADVFKALADETRRALLDELLLRDEQTLFELCSRLAMSHGISPSRQAVSQHLEVLEAAGLVHRERRGRFTFHTIDTCLLYTSRRG